MNKEIKEKWLTALRSGSYKQGQGSLHTKNLKGESKFCCLGVLVDQIKDPDKGQAWEDGLKPMSPSSEATVPFITGNTKENYEERLHCDLSEEMTRQVGLNDYSTAKLIRMNDTGSSFEEIADHIERVL